jgi:hypothetical protein
MSGAEDKPQGDAPAWQKAAQPEPDAEVESSKEAPATLEQARRFLEDPEVQKQTPERKIEFLRSKGLSESDIEELLKDVSQDPQTEPPVVVSLFASPHRKQNLISCVTRRGKTEQQYRNPSLHRQKPQPPKP